MSDKKDDRANPNAGPWDELNPSLSQEDRDEFLRIWQLAEAARGKERDVDVEGAFSLVQSAISDTRVTSTFDNDKSFTNSPLRYVSMAAALIVGIVIGLVVDFNPLAASRTINPAAGDGEFVLLIRNDSPNPTNEDERRAIVEAFTSWAGELAREGRLVAADELKREGRILLASEEGIERRHLELSSTGASGYFIFRASDLEEAMSIASECPHLEHGGTVEVREVVR